MVCVENLKISCEDGSLRLQQELQGSSFVGLCQPELPFEGLTLDLHKDHKRRPGISEVDRLYISASA